MIRFITWFNELNNSRRWIVTAVFSVILAVVLFGVTKAIAEPQRRGDNHDVRTREAFVEYRASLIEALANVDEALGNPPITWEKLPGDFTDISWAATPLPVDGVDAVALASPVSERTLMANGTLGNMLSDPGWRAWVSTKYYRQLEVIDVDGNTTDEERAEASKWATDLAVLVPLAFTDSLIEAAE